MSDKLRDKVFPSLLRKLNGVVPTLFQQSLIKYLDYLETEVIADLMLKYQHGKVLGVTSLLPTLQRELDAVLGASTEIRNLMVEIILSEEFARYPRCEAADEGCVMPCCHGAFVAEGMLTVILSPRCVEEIVIPEKPRFRKKRETYSPGSMWREGLYPAFALSGVLAKFVQGTETYKTRGTRRFLTRIPVPLRKFSVGLNIHSALFTDQDVLKHFSNVNRGTELDFYKSYVEDHMHEVEDAVFKGFRRRFRRRSHDEPSSVIDETRRFFTAVRPAHLTELTLHNLLLTERYQKNRTMESARSDASDLFDSIGKACPSLRKLDVQKVFEYFPESFLFLFFFETSIATHIFKPSHAYVNEVVEVDEGDTLCVCKIKESSRLKLRHFKKEPSYCPMCFDEWSCDFSPVRMGFDLTMTLTYVLPDEDYQRLKEKFLKDHQELFANTIKSSDLCSIPYQKSFCLRRPEGPKPWEEGFAAPPGMKSGRSAEPNGRGGFIKDETTFYMPEKYKYIRKEIPGERRMSELNPWMRNITEFLLPWGNELKAIIPFCLLHMPKLQRFGERTDIASALEVVRRAKRGNFKAFQKTQFGNMRFAHLDLNVDQRQDRFWSNEVGRSVPAEIAEEAVKYLSGLRPSKKTIAREVTSYIFDTLQDVVKYFPNLTELSISCQFLDQIPAPDRVWSELRKLKDLSTLKLQLGSDSGSYSAVISSVKVKHLYFIMDDPIFCATPKVDADKRIVKNIFYFDDILSSQRSLETLETKESGGCDQVDILDYPRIGFPRTLRRLNLEGAINWNLFADIFVNCSVLEELSISYQVTVPNDEIDSDEENPYSHPPNSVVTVPMIRALKQRRKLHKSLSKLHVGYPNRFIVHSEALILFMDMMPNLQKVGSITVMTRTSLLLNEAREFRNFLKWKQYYLARMRRSYNENPGGAFQCQWQWEDTYRMPRHLCHLHYFATKKRRAANRIARQMGIFGDVHNYLTEYAMPKR